jgi:hypothetical protein
MDMKNVLRLAVIAALVMGAGGVRADDDGDAANASQRAMEASSAAPKAGAERGAASMEPGEGIDEDPGTGAHQEWVQSIWTSP